MLTRRRLGWIAAIAAIVFLAVSVVLRLQLPNTSAAIVRRSAPSVGVAVNRKTPSIELLNEHGKPTSLEAMRGKWLAVAPTMTLCQTVCPITTGALMRLRQLMRRVGGGRRFTVVEVSTDPWRDSPRRLRAYRHRTGVHFPILTGSTTNLRRFWSFFGVHFARVPQGQPAAVDWMTGRRESFDVEHTDGVFLIDPGGRERVAIPGRPNLAGQLASPLRSLLDREGRKNLDHPTAAWSPADVASELRRLMGIRTPAPDPFSAATAHGRVSDSPAALIALHRQAGQLLGGVGLEGRLHSLRGLPAVVNVWASWCPPCAAELPLFANASASFGSRVAFLGADLEDDGANARRLLGEVSLAYPSYEVSAADLGSAVGPVPGTPVTFFIGPEGDVLQEHIGAYASQSILNADIRRFALAS